MTKTTAQWARRGAAGLVSAGLLLGLAPMAPARADPPSGPDRSPNVSVTDPEWMPDPIAEGTPRKPSRDVEKVKTQQRVQRKAAAAAAELPTFVKDGYALQTLPAAALPYKADLAPLEDRGLHDAQNVRMFNFGGQTWNHPVAQAQWGIANLTAYQANGQQFYLDRAIANAQRNVDRKVESRGAWWYPYDFDLTRCEGRPLIQAPWYSGMAQGLLLTLFVRLYEVTGDAQWKTAADQTFLSLTLPPEAGSPWGAWVDGNNQLWLEEYPATGTAVGERVLNGHIFAMYGVYDYWRTTGNPVAGEIFDGAASTVRRYLPTHFRNLRWASNYSIGCNSPHLKYHVIHTEQNLKLYEMTLEPTFAMNAYLLRSDYPAPTVSGTVQFQKGTHVGYTFNSAGAITGSKTITLGAISGAHADQRIRVIDRNYYYRITNGSLAGYLVPEVYGQRILLGRVQQQSYSPPRLLTFNPGTYTGYAYDTAGNVIATKTGTWNSVSGAPLGATAWVNGRLSYQVTAGAFVGYWLPHATGLAFS